MLLEKISRISYDWIVKLNIDYRYVSLREHKKHLIFSMICLIFSFLLFYALRKSGLDVTISAIVMLLFAINVFIFQELMWIFYELKEMNYKKH